MLITAVSATTAFTGGKSRRPLHPGGVSNTPARWDCSISITSTPPAHETTSNWGGDDLDELSRYDGLQAIRLTALGRYALGLTDTYQRPTGDNNTQGLKAPSNLDVVATGAFSIGDQLVLSGYAEHTADRVWTISAASLLAAINTGRDLTDFVTFLAEHTDHGLPDALGTLISDVTRRCAQLTDLLDTPA